ncbi:uncharacterized protein LOC132258264 [Phlebotomus argentipes]|uniref:uncharacterized protein LOC132258264 n=1 Tax=Phlebotomus argentipes TaxID=94469 RepID=UPI0028931F56|nr:uncharacterized protein LOC132258264 [Phlebotomus argentipes]
MMNNWRVADYKTNHEPEEHWKLRKAFMMKHKRDIPEDELVCLAQIMINIEFLGCRYSREVTLRIEELAKDLLADVRQKRKNRLRRTFVGASDAASAKVKRSSLADTLKRPTNTSEPPSKKRFQEESVDFTSKYGKIIIYDPSTDNFQQSAASLMQILRAKCGAAVVEQPSMLGDSFRTVILVNGQVAGQADSSSKASSKKEAYEDALAELKKHCFTLRVKNSFLSEGNETIRKPEEGAEKKTESQKLGEENLGFKLLKSLGWKGGSLGANNQGILNPVELSVNIGRQGLGANTNTDYYRSILRNYKNTVTLYDLVFTNEFNSDERAILHRLASQLGLKSKSYSKNEDRHLVISKKISLFDMAKDIIEQRDPALMEKFILVPPESPDL